MQDLNALTLTDIEHCLLRPENASYDLPRHMLDADLSPAGVLIPFVRVADSWHLLYIRRAELKRDTHSGQVAFPGGKFDETDTDLVDTALRETHEEIGVDPADIRVLGQLGSHHSASRFQITPVIGHIPWPYSLTLQESEVARVFSMPLNWLADPDNYEMRERLFPGAPQPVKVAYYKEYENELLWGATARMTLSLIKLLQLCRQDNPPED